MSLEQYRSLWEQPVFDLWSIPHFLSGTIFFVLFRWFRVHPLLAIAANVTIAIFWELFEIPTGLSSSEYWSNHVADILFAQLGFFAGMLFFKIVESEDNRRRFFWIVCGSFGLVALAGITCATLTLH